MAAKRKATNIADGLVTKTDGLISKKSKLELTRGVISAGTISVQDCESGHDGDGDHDTPTRVEHGTRKLARPIPRRKQTADGHGALHGSRIADDGGDIIQSAACSYPGDGQLIRRADRRAKEFEAKYLAAVDENVWLRAKLQESEGGKKQLDRELDKKIRQVEQTQKAVLQKAKKGRESPSYMMKMENRSLKENNQQLERERNAARDENASLKEEMAALRKTVEEAAAREKDQARQQEEEKRRSAASAEKKQEEAKRKNDELPAEVHHLPDIARRGAADGEARVANEELYESIETDGFDDSGLGDSLTSSSETPAYTILQPETVEQPSGLVSISINGSSIEEKAPACHPMPILFGNSTNPGGFGRFANENTTIHEVSNVDHANASSTRTFDIPPQLAPPPMSEKKAGKQPVRDQPQSSAPNPAPASQAALAVDQTNYINPFGTNKVSLSVGRTSTFGKPSAIPTPVAASNEPEVTLEVDQTNHINPFRANSAPPLNQGTSTCGKPSAIPTPALAKKAKGRIGPFEESDYSDEDALDPSKPDRIIERMKWEQRIEEKSKQKKGKHPRFESSDSDSDDTLFAQSKPDRTPRAETEAEKSTRGFDGCGFHDGGGFHDVGFDDGGFNNGGFDDRGFDDGHGFQEYVMDGCKADGDIPIGSYPSDDEMTDAYGTLGDDIDIDEDDDYALSRHLPDEVEVPSVFDQPSARTPTQEGEEDIGAVLEAIAQERRARPNPRNRRRRPKQAHRGGERRHSLGHGRESAPSPESHSDLPRSRSVGGVTNGRNDRRGSARAPPRDTTSRHPNRHDGGGIMKRDSCGPGLARSDSYRPTRHSPREGGDRNGSHRNAGIQSSSDDEAPWLGGRVPGLHPPMNRYAREELLGRLNGGDQNERRAHARDRSSDNYEGYRSRPRREFEDRRAEIKARTRALERRLRYDSDLEEGNAKKVRFADTSDNEAPRSQPPSTVDYYERERAMQAARRTAAHAHRAAVADESD